MEREEKLRKKKDVEKWEDYEKSLRTCLFGKEGWMMFELLISDRIRSTGYDEMAKSSGYKYWLQLHLHNLQI